MANSIVPISVMQNSSIPNMQLSYPVYPLEILSISSAIYGRGKPISTARRIHGYTTYKVRNGKWSLNGGKRRLAAGYKLSLKSKAITPKRIRCIGFRDTEYEDE